LPFCKELVERSLILISQASPPRSPQEQCQGKQCYILKGGHLLVSQPLLGIRRDNDKKQFPPALFEGETFY
jgi:hypothetical protein